MKRFILLLFIILLIFTGLSYSNANKTPLNKISVVMDNNYPPYVFLDSNGNLQGILIDQWRLWEQKTGIRAAISGMDWGEALRRMEAGEFDVIDTIFFNERRARIYDFTKPYAKIDVSIFFHKDISGIKDADSLHGFSVAVKTGDAAIDYLKGRGIKLFQEYPSYEAIIIAAKERKVMVTVIDNPPALYFLYKIGILDEFRHSAPLYTGEFHRAVRKGNTAILKQVEGGFARISESEYRDINWEWFGIETSVFGQYFINIVIYIGLLILIVLSIFIVWNQTLRMNVRKRTLRLENEIALNNAKTEALKKSEEKYRELVENANSIILRMDKDGRVAFFNEFAEQFFGFPKEEIIGKSVIGTIVPEKESTGRDLVAMIADISRNPEAYTTNENENIRRNGEVVWIAWTNKPIFDKNGDVSEILCVGNDITDRKRVEEELAYRNTILSTQQESTIDGILVVDEKGVIISFNKRFVDMWAIPKEVIKLKSDESALQSVFHKLKYPEQFLQKVNFLYDHRHETSQDEILLRDGRVFDRYSAPMLGTDGKYYGRIWYFRDITEHKQADEALRRSEEMVRTFLNANTETMLLVDRDGIILFGNETFQKRVGKPMDKLIGTCLYDHFPPEVAENRKFHVQAAIQSKNIENFIDSRAGRIYDHYHYPVFNTYGDVDRVAIFALDITERKQAEERERAAFRRIMDIINFLPDATFVIDYERKVVAWNNAMEELTEIKAEDMIGKGNYEYALPFYGERRPILIDLVWEPSEEIEKKYNNIERRGNILSGEAYMPGMEGGKIYLYGTAAALRDANGKITGAIESIRNITDRKDAEDALKKSEEKYRSIFENAVMGIFQTTPDGRFLSINPAGARIYGYESAEEMKRFITDMSQQIYVNPKDRERFIENIESKGYIEGFESEHYRKDRSKIWTLLYSRAVRDNAGKTLYYETTTEDITERKLAEEALKKGELKYRTLFEFANDAIILIRDGRIIDCNSLTLRMFGCLRDQIVGEPPLLFSPAFQPDGKESWEKSREKMAAALSSGPQFFEWKHCRLDGTVFDAEVNLNRIELGNEILLQAIIRDITARKLAEEALRESESKFRTLAEKSFVGIYLLQDGVFKYVNERLAEISGYSPEEMINNLSYKDLIYHEDLPMVEENIGKRLSGEEKTNFYGFRGRTKNGKIKYVEVYSSQTFYQGKPAIIVTLLDVTDRYRAEAELRRLSTAIENTGEEVIITDPEGIIQYVNPAFEKISGYSRDEAIGQNPRIVQSGVHDKAFYENLWSTIKSGNVWTGTITNRRKDGVFIQEDATISPIKSSCGSITGFVALRKDITEELILQSNLVQAQKMEALGTLTGGIAHDFNNLLTVMSGYATLIQTELNTPDTIRGYVDEIVEATKKATSLTGSLLTFSRKQPVILAPLDLNDAIKETEKLLKRLLSEDIELRTSLIRQDTIVMADKSQIDQILFNIITNARDAMPRGGAVNIETAINSIDDNFRKRHGFGKPGEYVLIKISDTGSGMDQSTIEKIFDPFFTTKEAGKGTGLGLATVYGIVKKHGGYITVESMRDKGTTFHIYFPIVTTKAATAQDTATPIQTGKETILVAEDNADVRRFIREALQQYGYTIIEAKDGEDAIDKYKQNKDIDLVVIDTVMPKKSGREVYDSIHSVNVQVKTLFISGYTKDTLLDKGIEEKDFNFISKPLIVNTFLQKVREVLDRM